MPRPAIAIIDGNSLLHRAFHALPLTLTGSDGRPTNAVYGFLTMLFRLVEELDPDGVVVTFDCGKPAFRIEILEHYKAHRPPTAVELKDQFPMVERALEAMAVPVVKLEGWEADDLLGTLSRLAVEAGHDALLVTGDRDALQLVDEHVRVITTRKGVSEVVVFGPAEVEAKLGVPPELVVDYLGLKGDTSDNIPGVPGVGEKTAAKLLQEYGSLDAVLAAAGEIKGKVGENLRSHAQDALDSRVVATIRRDVPVGLDIAGSGWGGWDAAEVLAVFKDFRVASLVGKVLAEADIKVAEADSRGVAERLPVVCGAEAKEALAARLDEPTDAWLGVALGGTGADSLLPEQSLFVALPDAVAEFEEAEVATVLARLLEEGRIASPDVKALLGEVAGASSGAEGAFDVLIAAYLLDSARSSYDVLALFAEESGTAMEAGNDERAAQEAQAAAYLAPRLSSRLEEAGSLELFSECEMPLVGVLAEMERTGVAIDCEVLRGLASEMGEEIERLVVEIREIAGADINIDSPKQLGEVLFDKLGLPKGKRTKTGFSTDSTVLAPLADAYPIAAKVLAYRELAKLKSTYVDALPRLVGPSGRLHTTFNQTVAATGRLSSSNPNLQNIPIRTELGRKIRAAFVPGDGFDVLMTADYSQIELRILAHLSGDAGLSEAFTSGEDFHTATAARVFGVSPDAVDSGLRSRAKATNFGIIYGISAHGLSVQLGIGRAEAQEMIDRYYAAYPAVRAFLDGAVESARSTGFAVTMFGRRRPIPELASRDYNVRSFGERTAMNHPMQGAAADIMKLAMVEVARRLADSGLTSRMVLQVHDELVFEAKRSEVEAVEKIAREAMAGVADLLVPLEVDVAVGADWASAK